MKEIRYITAGDLEAITDLAMEFSKEYELVADRDSITLSITNLLNNPNSVLLGAWLNNKLIGAILGVGSLTIFNTDMSQMNEVMYYVTPEHRGDRAGVELVQTYIDVAKERNYNAITMIAPHHLKIEALDKMYKHFGFKEYETTYIMEI